MQNLLRQSIGAAPARGRHATLGIRPQYVSVSDGVEDAALSGEVVMTRRRGTDMIVDPEFPDGSRVSLSLETDYPVDGQVRLRIGCERPTAFTLRLRIPAWSRSTRVFVGDSVMEPHPGSYAEIELEWRDGDAVVLELDMRTRAVPAPSGAPQFALIRGPLVLALDRRLVEPDDRSLLLVTDSEGYVEACPVPSPDPRILFTCEVPFLYHKVHIEKIPQGLLMCDYASAGNTWSAESLFRTWLPQPLFMRQAFIEGTDRLQNPKGWGHG